MTTMYSPISNLSEISLWLLLPQYYMYVYVCAPVWIFIFIRCDRLMGDSSGEAEAWANAGQ